MKTVSGENLLTPKKNKTNIKEVFEEAGIDLDE